MTLPFFSFDFTRRKHRTAGFFSAVLTLSCFAAAAGCGKAPADFDAYTQQLFCNSVSANTLNLHYTLSSPETYGIVPSRITLGDLSEDAINTAHAATENTLSVLKTYNYRSLSDEQQLTYDILYDFLSTEQSAADLVYYDEPLRPSTGISSQLPILFEEYKFYDKQDVEDYLALIACTDEYFVQIAEFEARKAELGLFMSDTLCRQLISQCESFVQNPESHYLIETFDKKIAALEGLTDSERQDFSARNASAVTKQVLPAYERLSASLEALLGSGKNDGGLCYLPEGNKFYQYLVYYNTGCADDIPAISARIQKQRQEDLAQAASHRPIRRSGPNARISPLPEWTRRPHSPYYSARCCRNFQARRIPVIRSAILTSAWRTSWLLPFISPPRLTITGKILFLSTPRPTVPPCSILRRSPTRVFPAIFIRP